MPTLTTLVDGTVPVAADFNGNFSALNNAIGSGTSISAWALGEIPYASAANTLSRLTPGSTGQVLTMQASGIPGWGSATYLDQLTGLGLANNGSDATNDIDIAVGACASDDATVANRVLISLASGLTKQLDAAWAVGTNQGGRASGAAIADTTYHVFVIMRPDTGVVDVAFDTSATGANIAANTNSAYTKIRRIGSILREGGAIVAFHQFGDEFLRDAPSLDINQTNPGTSAVTAALSVPAGIAVKALINLLVDNSTSASLVVYVSALASTDSAASRTAAPLGSLGTGSTDGNAARAGQVAVWTNTSRQIRYRASVSGASDVVRAATLGWIDRRGRG